MGFCPFVLLNRKKGREIGRILFRVNYLITNTYGRLYFALVKVGIFQDGANPAENVRFGISSFAGIANRLEEVEIPFPFDVRI